MNKSKSNFEKPKSNFFTKLPWIISGVLWLIIIILKVNKDQEIPIIQNSSVGVDMLEESSIADTTSPSIDDNSENIFKNPQNELIENDESSNTLIENNESPNVENTISHQWINCGRCGGKGEIRCNGCRGRGDKECNSTFCRGGYDRDGDLCNSCGGKGTKRCYDCGGSGWYKCQTCRGRGQVYE